MRTTHPSQPAGGPHAGTGPSDDTHPDTAGTARRADAPPPGEPGRETLERQAAWRRGDGIDARRARGDEAPRDPYAGLAHPEIARHAFAALAENVRDYAIFLLDPDGIITFWGEGARLMKWWTREEAEGGHLRMLYPDGGSEDGTAEEHLLQAARDGEYTGEGHRVRGDCSTFWGGITLTGEQRFRPGWTEAEVVREHQILAEELAAAIRRHVRRERAREVEEMIDAVWKFLATGERVSLESYRRAARA